jgi:hypothetical protein
VIQLFPTLIAVEVVRMYNLKLVHQVFSVYGQTTLLTKLFRATFDVSIARLAKWSSLALDKANVSQLLVATHTLEAVWVPALAHGPNHSPHHKFSTATATGCKEGMKVMGTVFPPLMLKKLFVLEWLKALHTYKASLVPHLSSRVDNVLVSIEWVLTQRTHHSRVHGWTGSVSTLRLLEPGSPLRVGAVSRDDLYWNR